MKKTILTIGAITLLTACTTANTTTQVAESAAQNPAWNTQYGGADKSYDKNLIALREQIAPRFKQLEFVDPVTGKTMAYNLYTPKNIDPNKKYPLVMFIADASTVGKGVIAPLMQGYGGIIWATDESQAKNPAFVLVPSFAGPQSAVNDKWETSDEVGMALRLLKQTIKTKPIDSQRVYTTGQSMGGMISFYLNATEPDLFAASMFVGSQWDINVLGPLTKKKFIYTVSAADPKASAGMKQVIDLMKTNHVAFAETEFSAKLPQSEQNKQVSDILSQGKSVNFIRFSPNTVPPEGSTHKGGEHMYSFDYAYLLEPARDWLFSQRKDE